MAFDLGEKRLNFTFESIWQTILSKFESKAFITNQPPIDLGLSCRSCLLIVKDFFSFYLSTKAQFYAIN